MASMCPGTAEKNLTTVGASLWKLNGDFNA